MTSENEHDDKLSGLLAQAVRQLVETPCADVRPADLDALVLQELSRADGSLNRTSPTIATRRKKERPMPLPIKYLLAASLLIAAGTATWLGLPLGTKAVYGAVAERLKTLRTVVYRVQWAEEAALANVVVGDGDKVIYVAPSHHRIERSNGSVMVIDTQAEKAVELTPANKRALVMNGQMGKNMAVISRGPESLLETLQKHFHSGSELPQGVEGLGKKAIQGVQAQGLRSTMNGEVVEAWINPATSLPVEVRICLVIPGHLSGLAGQATRVWRIMSAIEYDIAVDPSLMSVKVPAGYTLIQMPDVSVANNDAASSLADLINTLRLCATHNDSTFPASLALNDAPGTCMAIMKRFASTQEEVWTSGTEAEKQASMEAVAEFGAALGRMTPFLFALRPENKLRYVGDSVKLDTPNRAILWFSPKGDAKFQVVYADLSLKEVTESALPRLPAATRAEPEDRTVIRSTSPRIVFPRSAVRDYDALQSILGTGRQAEVRFLELQMMSQFMKDGTIARAKSNPQSSRFAFLEELQNLEGLRVDHLALTETDLDAIGHCQNLKKLSLSGIQMVEASGAKHRLRGIELRNLSQLKNLEVLDLSQSNFSGGLQHLGKLPKLHTLILSSFENLNDASVAQLKELPHLQTLVLAPVYANNPEKTVTDAGLASLRDLPSLRTLYVEYHGRWTIPVEKLKSLLPGVNIQRGFQEQTSVGSGAAPPPIEARKE